MYKRDIYNFTKEELTTELSTIGEKPYRAKQLFTWLYDKRAKAFEDMTDLSKKLRTVLDEKYSIGSMTVDTVQRSKLDGTQKFLFRLQDRGFIEGVFMKYREWNTACISSQVGCAMGCRFCASAIGGLERNMTAGEMAEEVHLIEETTGEHVSNIVVMGTGEPLANYDELIRFLKIMTDEDGRHMSQRGITVSTCGIVPGIERLAGEKLNGEHLQINLAVSLHASNDEKRKKIMPIADRYSIGEIMAAAGRYYDATHRRLTFEYALIEGVNDGPEDAKELAGLLKSIPASDIDGGTHPVPALVNLIPVNPVRESGLRRPSARACSDFKNKLENFGINGSIRRELGSDIDGACGQLRRRK